MAAEGVFAWPFSSGQISGDARRQPLGVGGCRHNSVDWRGVSFGSPLCVAVKRLVAKGAAKLFERHCHHGVTLPSRRAARHVKAPDGTGNAHAPPYAAIPMPGGIAISSYTGVLRSTCHCVRRRVFPRANSSHSETVLQQAAAQGTQCEAATDVPSGCGGAYCDERTDFIARRFSSKPSLKARSAKRQPTSHQVRRPGRDRDLASHCVPLPAACWNTLPSRSAFAFGQTRLRTQWHAPPVLARLPRAGVVRQPRCDVIVAGRRHAPTGHRQPSPGQSGSAPAVLSATKNGAGPIRSAPHLACCCPVGASPPPCDNCMAHGGERTNTSVRQTISSLATRCRAAPIAARRRHLSFPKTPSGGCISGKVTRRIGWRGRKWPHRSR